MPTINARLAQIVRPMPAILALLILATPAGAQRAVAPGTPVRITLADQQVVEGRLLSGDSSSLTVRTGVADLVVARREIATMSAEIATRSMRYGGRLGLASALSGAVFGGLLAEGLCETASSCENAGVVGGVAGGGFGLVVGGTAGAVFGALFHDWKTVPASVAVGGREFGPLAPERCTSNPGIAIQGNFGASSLRSASKRVGVTLLCRASFSVGAEAGSFGSDVRGVYTYSSTATTSTSTSRNFVHAADVAGAFVEIPMGGRFNPRLIASAGSYRRTEKTSGMTSTWNGTTSQFTALPSTSTTSNHPGGSLGIALSMPLWKYLSLGADARIHMMTGASSIRTLGVTLKVRP